MTMNTAGRTHDLSTPAMSQAAEAARPPQAQALQAQATEAPGSLPAWDWGGCPNCRRPMPADAPACAHCDAEVSDPGGWHVQALPGGPPSQADREAWAEAVTRRAAQAAADAARRPKPQARLSTMSLGEQLLQLPDGLELDRSDSASEAETAFAGTLLMAGILLIPAALLGGLYTLTLCALMAVMLVSAQSARQAGHQRRVVMDTPQQQVVVSARWPRQPHTYERRIPWRALEVSLLRQCSSHDDMEQHAWLLELVLPQDVQDPGAHQIRLATFAEHHQAEAASLRDKLLRRLHQPGSAG